jgi:putative phosphoesterase
LFVLIGILSDTHDRIDTMAAAMELLRQEGAQYFIHCGDVGGEGIFDLLAVPAAFVWGNTDFDRENLGKYATNLGIKCCNEFGKLAFAEKRIVVTHGDHPELMRRAQQPGFCDYLLHGHTHIIRDERIGSLRIINPGALQRAATKTVALLDLEKDILKHLTVSL